MKKLLSCAALCVASATASAGGFSLSNVLLDGGQTFAAVSVGESGFVKYTGTNHTSSSLFDTSLTVQGAFGPATTLTEVPQGQSATVFVNAGLLNFFFEGDAGLFATNGTAYNATPPGPSFSVGGFVDADMDGFDDDNKISLFFDDSGKGQDYNDFVAEVTFTAAVPEPSTYALMFAGLGVVGFIARRRRTA